jgi:alkanesulfonate monooxygenase SsuD/methylene tetrahydromethanopterin reductase-like flavin-dependent oxidoreductase (luciferase family)
MRFGFVGSFGSAVEVVDMAVEAETHGWDGFFTWDGVALDGMEAWDPWAVLAAAAVRTSKIRLGALVFALPRRRPWVFAKQAVTVDHLSGGRVVLPVGLGVPDDRAVTGVAAEAPTIRERAELLDEDLAILEHAFSGEKFSYAGTHHTITDMQLLPRPVQLPRIPVWVVGAYPSERSMGRAARWDGVVPQLRGDRTMDQMTPADVAEVVGWVRAHREPGPVPYDVVIQGTLPEDPAEAVAVSRALAEAGATWFVESRWDPKTATPDVLTERIRQGPPIL